MPYDPLLVEPMRRELTEIGVAELRTIEEVDEFMRQTQGTMMIVVNSVCGCAAGSARPGVRLSLKHENRPDRVGTVFAGQDLKAAERARSHFADLPPSSPSLVLFKDGEVVHFVPRHQIEGKDPQSIAADLTAAFDKHCVSAGV